jgi:hypothetical protein
VVLEMLQARLDHSHPTAVGLPLEGTGGGETMHSDPAGVSVFGVVYCACRIATNNRTAMFEARRH